VLVCAYRSVSVETFESVINLLTSGTWRYAIRSGDAWIGRARSVIASQWYRETDDDVFTMVDADIVFKPSDLQRLADACRMGYDIVCADYPVHNGQFLAGRFLPPGRVNEHGLVEMEYAPAGCMAVRRRVLDTLVDTLPLCHGSMPIAYWPFFIPFMAYESLTGDNVPLSEDFAFTDRARAAGFHAWRDTSLRVGHLSEFVLSEDNMAAMHKAAGQPWVTA
jgi:hypothetical protein